MINRGHRRSIRLPNYDYSTGGAYFVTICTYEHRKTLCTIKESQPLSVGAHPCVRPSPIGIVSENRLWDLEEKFSGITLDHFVIMPNHIHFVLFFEGAHAGAPLHEVVKWYKTQTTNDCIRMVKNGTIPPFNKHIWQRNYYEHVIRGEKDLYETRKYIENNPVKWTTDKYYSKED